ncbi:MAG: RnfABCDGE type electron transport complex subunit G [Clostridia bacterium]
MKKKQDWLILCVIALVAALLLAVTNVVTKDQIAIQAAAALDSARSEALPQAARFEKAVSDKYGVSDSQYVRYEGYATDGTMVGYVAELTVNGFAGPIEIVCGIDLQGTITGLSVGGSNFSETAGLGTKVRDEEFTSRFVNLTSTPKAGDNVDTIAGATISSSAVISGVSKCYDYMRSYMEGYVPEAAEVLTAEHQETVTVHGFASDFDVTVGIMPDQTIEGVLIGGDSFAESAGIGEKVLEKEFRDQFKGKSGMLAYGENGLDAISGATITSEAVLKGINLALNGDSAAAAPAAPAFVEETLTPSADNNQAVLSRKVTVRGFADEIDVTVGIDAEGKIATLSVGGPKFKETEYFGDKARDNAFRNQFIGKAGTIVYGENGVDAISGATITSTAVLQAVNTALKGQ